MLHAIQPESGPVPDSVLSAMFAARKSVFVDLLKWDVPVIAGAFEIDQFDTPSAHYLVLADDQGAHLGSARLLPTTAPHILGDIFPQLCEETPPRGEAIFEITRFCLDRRLRAPERRAVRDTLVTALANHALAQGISDYVAVADLGWYQQVLAFGWRCVPLGLPQVAGGSTLAALRISITADTPTLLARAGIAARLPILGDERRAAA